MISVRFSFSSFTFCFPARPLTPHAQLPPPGPPGSASTFTTTALFVPSPNQQRLTKTQQLFPPPPPPPPSECAAPWRPLFFVHQATLEIRNTQDSPGTGVTHTHASSRWRAPWLPLPPLGRALRSVHAACRPPTHARLIVMSHRRNGAAAPPHATNSAASPQQRLPPSAPDMVRGSYSAHLPALLFSRSPFCSFRFCIFASLGKCVLSVHHRRTSHGRFPNTPGRPEDGVHPNGPQRRTTARGISRVEPPRALMIPVDPTTCSRGPPCVVRER
jgi:hypothetical protein